MEIKTRHILGIIIGIGILILDYLFIHPVNIGFFRAIIAIAVFAGISQFWFDSLRESKRQREIEEKFLEFARSLEETVRSGIPIPKAIVEISHTDFGPLTIHVKKLARDIQWGVPMREALNNFAKRTKNKMIKRSISIVIEAEQSGGNIQDVLAAVTASVLQIKKIKEERRASTFSQMIQGYVVFFIFIGIMIVLQLYLLPQLSDISGTALTGIGSMSSILEPKVDVPATINFDIIFTFLILVQGFFAGLLIGKFAEGDYKVGLKHSIILMLFGYLIFAAVTGF